MTAEKELLDEAEDYIGYGDQEVGSDSATRGSEYYLGSIARSLLVLVRKFIEAEEKRNP